ncbi:MAG: NUDIX hydrolase, partial [Solirubrobacterales bacterium]
PRQVEIRFDTHFFVAHLPEGATVTIDGSEIVDHRWYSPQAALEAHRADELELVFPTVKHLEQLAAFGSARELVEYAGSRDVEPVEPRVLIEGEVARVVLPGEPGYD